MTFPPKINFEVLVIDDQPEDKRMVDQVLKLAGFLTRWCKDWNEVERLLRERFGEGLSLPDVILVDMHFHGDHCIIGANPSIEGLFIIRKLIKVCRSREVEPPPIVGFTGKEHYMEPEEILEAGATDFITEAEFNKPEYFARRLIQSVLEAQVESSLKPRPVASINVIEEDIVLKALEKNSRDVEKAAGFLRWPIEEVQTITARLASKGAL